MNQVSITIDVESDWGGRLPPFRENCIGIEKGIPQLLALLDNFNIKATFFISCSLLPLYCEMVKEIKWRGHEIASHGLQHIDYSGLSKSGLMYQVKASRELLEDSLNCDVIGFRAPQFRLHANLYEVLFTSGYKYDSSVVCGTLRGRYENARLHKKPFEAENKILEIPISNIPLTNKPMGLLWINHLGFLIFSILDRFSVRRQNIIFYLHPFDILERKSRNDFGFIVNFWYALNSKRALDTLNRFIDYYVTNSEFVTLNKYL